MKKNLNNTNNFNSFEQLASSNFAKEVGFDLDVINKRKQIEVEVDKEFSNISFLRKKNKNNSFWISVANKVKEYVEKSSSAKEFESILETESKIWQEKDWKKKNEEDDVINHALAIGYEILCSFSIYPSLEEIKKVVNFNVEKALNSNKPCPIKILQETYELIKSLGRIKHIDSVIEEGLKNIDTYKEYYTLKKVWYLFIQEDKDAMEDENNEHLIGKFISWIKRVGNF